MLPVLFPIALAIFVIVSVGLVAFLRWYVMARPGMAVIVRREASEPLVLLQGGAFARARTSLETVDMTPRTLSIRLRGEDALAFSDGRFGADIDVDVRTRPNEKDVLATVAAVGLETHNDQALLARHLSRVARPALESFAASVTSAQASEPSHASELAAALAERAPFYEIERCVLVVHPG